MGFMVFLAGDTRVALPNAVFMMHSLAYSLGDTPQIVKNHEIDVIQAKKMNNVMLEIMAERTNRNKKWWYRNILNNDKYFDVTEAIELGIIKPPVKKVVRKVKKNVKRN